MPPETLKSPDSVTIRPLVEADFEAVVAIDRALGGATRRGYFERRLRWALRQPKRHLQIAAEANGRLVGFLLARLAGGEFGRPAPTAVLETVGVEPGLQRSGVGLALLTRLEALARTREAAEIGTQAEWRNHRMLAFLDRGGFSLAPRTLLERPVDRVPVPDDDAILEKPPHPVRRLRAEDFDAIARIDKALVGRDRREYLGRKFDEVLNESAMEVSLVVEDDGLPVGFVMARVDFGDFGHVEGVATLDTIGVRPGFDKKGIGRDLLAQLINNLAALHVERIETEVAREGFGLLGFLYQQGFGPSQELSFTKRL